MLHRMHFKDKLCPGIWNFGTGIQTTQEGRNTAQVKQEKIGKASNQTYDEKEGYKSLWIKGWWQQEELPPKRALGGDTRQVGTKGGDILDIGKIVKI